MKLSDKIADPAPVFIRRIGSTKGSVNAAIPHIGLRLASGMIGRLSLCGQRSDRGWFEVVISHDVAPCSSCLDQYAGMYGPDGPLPPANERTKAV